MTEESLILTAQRAAEDERPEPIRPAVTVRAEADFEHGDANYTPCGGSCWHYQNDRPCPPPIAGWDHIDDRRTA